MPALDHWVRGADGSRQRKQVPEQRDLEEVVERLDAAVLQVPYFQQAAQVILFAKTNTNTYPRTMSALRDTDDHLIRTGAYKGLTEGQKAKLLVEATADALGVDL